MIREIANIITLSYFIVYIISITVVYFTSDKYSKNKNTAITSLILSIFGTLIVPYGILTYTESSSYSDYGLTETNYSSSFEYYTPGIAFIIFIWIVTIIFALLAYVEKTKGPKPPPPFLPPPWQPQTSQNATPEEQQSYEHPSAQDIGPPPPP